MIRKLVGGLLDVALIGLVFVVVLTAAVGPIATLTGRTPLVIGGGSMSPAIPMGSVAFVERAPAGLLAGDIGTFRTPSLVLVSHRVVRVVQRADGTWYETKGDANADVDPALWPASSLVGRVSGSVPGVGFASWLFRHPVGWLNVIMIASWLIAARALLRRADVARGVPAGEDDRAALPVEGPAPRRSRAGA